MKKNHPVLVSGIVLCCLIGATAYAAIPGNTFPEIFSKNPASEVLPLNNEKAFEETEKLIISYKSPFHYTFNKDTQWEIIHSETGLPFKKGAGTITNLVFEIPGNYVIHVAETKTHQVDSCDHAHFPEKILLEVSPFSMVFDFSTVKLSKNIVGNQSLNGTLTVDVQFSSWDGSSATYAQPFTTAGIRTTLTGKLKNGEIILQQGSNTLEFQLDGQVAKNSYISIDFRDIHGQIQSYNITNKIQ